jgi:hypothetical protein
MAGVVFEKQGGGGSGLGEKRWLSAVLKVNALDADGDFYTPFSTTSAILHPVDSFPDVYEEHFTAQTKDLAAK